MLAEARGVIADLHARSTRVLVMLSGGKDSVLTLHLAREKFTAEQVVCCFFYFVEGLRVVEEPVELVTRRYGVRLIKLPHFAAASMMRDAQYMPNRHEHLTDVRELKMLDLELEARDRSGAEWVLAGHRKVDSLERRGMITSSGLIDEKNRRAYPIANWSHRQAWDCTRAWKLPLAPYLGARAGKASSSGIRLDPTLLLDMKRRYPRDYERLLETFPYARALVFREEERARRAHEVSERQHRGDPPE